MLNALRLSDGFAADLFESRSGLAWQQLAAPLAALARRGLLEFSAAGCRPSRRGLHFLNDLLLEFLPETPKKSGVYAMSMATPEVAAEPPEKLLTARTSSVQE
jgi:hypothetical protein